MYIGLIYKIQLWYILSGFFFTLSSYVQFIIALLFTFPLMFKTQYVSYHVSAEKIQIIANRCQGCVVILLFSNMTL